MTITTTQFNMVKLAVNTIMEGNDLESVFLPKVGAENLEEIIQNFNDFTNSFSINELDTTQLDIEYALDTLEKVANNIVDYFDMDVFSELSDYYSFDEVMEMIENEEIVFHGGVFEMSELAENYVDDCGLPNNYQFYIDEDALLRDLYYGGDIQDYYYNLIKEDALLDGKEEEEAEKIACDYEPTNEDEQNYLEMVLECCSEDKEFVKRYFDYDMLGRDMEIEGNYITCDSGLIEVTM